MLWGVQREVVVVMMILMMMMRMMHQGGEERGCGGREGWGWRVRAWC